MGLLHSIMPSYIVLLFFCRKQFAIRQNFVCFWEMNDSLGCKLVIHIVIHGYPIAVVNTLTLCPNLFSCLIDWIRNFWCIPTYKVNTFSGSCLVGKFNFVLFTPFKGGLKVNTNTFIKIFKSQYLPI
ncbi:MAG: Uncharacterised protein [Bacteroidetes bacterium MED-G17]|nr:MAG: Uncharacterised protein [Bacteroidetes bacterium MED-G17]